MAKATLGYGKRRLITEIIKKTWETENPEDVKLSYTDVLYIIQEMEDEEGKKYLEEDYSMRRGHHVFKEFTKQLLYRNLANYDSMVLITSEKGSGKSSSAIMMARLWCQLIGIRFDANRHMAYTNQDVMNKIDSLNKFEPMICLSGCTKIIIRENNEIKYVNIRDLVNKKDFEIISYNKEKNIFEYKKPEKCVRTSNKETVYEIELENGRKIRATENHMFLTETGYKKLKNLTTEDKIKQYTKECIICKKEFIPKNQRFDCCSKNCSYINYQNKRRGNKKVIQYLREYRIKNKEKLKKKRDENRDRRKIVRREYMRNNEDARLRAYKKTREYYQNNKKRLKELNKKWIKNNKERHRKYLNDKHKELMQTDETYKIKRNLRRRIGLALKDKGIIKDKSLHVYTGCNIEKLKKHIENQFTEGMNWDNYGLFGWHIDHIRPCASFDLTKKEEQMKCFHYTNLQPLWCNENLSKGYKYEGEIDVY